MMSLSRAMLMRSLLMFCSAPEKAKETRCDARDISRNTHELEKQYYGVSCHFLRKAFHRTRWYCA